MHLLANPCTPASKRGVLVWVELKIFHFPGERKMASIFVDTTASRTLAVVKVQTLESGKQERQQAVAMHGAFLRDRLPQSRSFVLPTFLDTRDTQTRQDDPSLE